MTNDLEKLREEIVGALLDCFMNLGWGIEDGAPEMIADRILSIPTIADRLAS